MFKPKSNVPFLALEAVNNKLDSLEKIGVISKINYSEWASLYAYIKKIKK